MNTEVHSHLILMERLGGFLDVLHRCEYHQRWLSDTATRLHCVGLADGFRQKGRRHRMLRGPRKVQTLILDFENCS